MLVRCKVSVFEPSTALIQLCPCLDHIVSDTMHELQQFGNLTDLHLRSNDWVDKGNRDSPYRVQIGVGSMATMGLSHFDGHV